MKAVHINAQSLFCHIDELRLNFDSTAFDIICISETWLKPYTSTRSVELTGYNLYRNDRLYKRGGGVGIYVKSHMPVSVLHQSDTSVPGRPEYLFLDVNVNGTHILVSVCYRPPHVGFLANFEHILLDLMVSYSHVIVMGDFNTDLLGPPTYDKTYLTTLFDACSMTILPFTATHHTATADTWLDLITVSDPTLVIHHEQVPAPCFSRHDLIFCVYRIHQPKPISKFVTYRNFKNINLEALLADACNRPWLDVTNGDDVDVKVEKFAFHLTAIFNKHAPLTKKRVTKQPAPWLSDFIRRSQKERDASFRKARRTKSALDWNIYKRLRNSTQQHIRNAKARFLHLSLSKYQSSKKLWSKLKDLGIGKSNSKCDIPLDLNAINEYFVDIPIDSTGARDYVAQLEAVPMEIPNRQFSFVPVTEADVLWAIGRTTSGAVGADGIPIRFLKDTLPVTLPIITNIFNTSLSAAKFTKAWKSVTV